MIRCCACCGIDDQGLKRGRECDQGDFFTKNRVKTALRVVFKLLADEDGWCDCDGGMMSVGGGGFGICAGVSGGGNAIKAIFSQKIE